MVDGKQGNCALYRLIKRITKPFFFLGAVNRLPTTFIQSIFGTSGVFGQNKLQHLEQILDRLRYYDYFDSLDYSPQKL